MCIGMETMALVSLVAGAASTGMQVLGSMQQGKAAQAQANYQAAVANNNAKLAEWQAQDAIERGKEEERQHRTQVQRFLGSQRAAIAGSGFEMGDETSLSLLSDTAAQGELDALTIRSNAEREAWGYKVQGSNYQADAGLARMRGQSAASSSMWAAGSDLLSGAAKFGSTYQDYKQKGVKLWG